MSAAMMSEPATADNVEPSNDLKRQLDELVSDSDEDMRTTMIKVKRRKTLRMKYRDALVQEVAAEEAAHEARMRVKQAEIAAVDKILNPKMDTPETSTAFNANHPKPSVSQTGAGASRRTSIFAKEREIFQARDHSDSASSTVEKPKAHDALPKPSSKGAHSSDGKSTYCTGQNAPKTRNGGHLQFMETGPGDPDYNAVFNNKKASKGKHNEAQDDDALSKPSSKSTHSEKSTGSTSKKNTPETSKEVLNLLSDDEEDVGLGRTEDAAKSESLTTAAQPTSRNSMSQSSAAEDEGPSQVTVSDSEIVEETGNSGEFDKHGNPIVPVCGRAVYGGPMIYRRPHPTRHLPNLAHLNRFPAAVPPPGMPAYVNPVEQGMQVVNGLGGMNPYLYIDSRFLPLCEAWVRPLKELSFGGLFPKEVKLDYRGYFLYFSPSWRLGWVCDLAATEHALKACERLMFNGYALKGAFLYTGHTKRVTNSNTPGPWKNTRDQFQKAARNGNPLRR